MSRDPFSVDDESAPSLIGPSFVAESNGEQPELAYLPSQRLGTGDAEVTLELRRTNDNRLAVLAYTSLEALVSSCGEMQPWVSLPMDGVDVLARDSQADVVLWDAALPREQRRDHAETEDAN